MKACVCRGVVKTVSISPVVQRAPTQGTDIPERMAGGAHTCPRCAVAHTQGSHSVCSGAPPTPRIQRDGGTALLQLYMVQYLVLVTSEDRNINEHPVLIVIPHENTVSLTAEIEPRQHVRSTDEQVEEGEGRMMLIGRWVVGCYLCVVKCNM